MKGFDRRDFLKGAALGGMALAGMGGMAACSSPNTTSDTGPSSSEQDWGAEYDVVVVGFGGAGAMAAKVAADEGAKVLVLEKADEANGGGNTRFCSQMIVHGHGDKEATYSYYKGLMGSRPIPDDVLRAYTDGIADVWDIAAEEYGLDKGEFVEYPYPAEYPEFEGAEKVNMSTLHEGSADAYLWNIQKQAVIDCADMIDVWYESPAVELVLDHETGTVTGVLVDHAGTQEKVRAANGVVLSCGGFEGNQEMVRDYLGFSNYAACGSVFNTGDGIKLATKAGGDLWHMHAYESMGMLGGLSYQATLGERAEFFFVPVLYSGSLVLVGTDGLRYIREDEGPRHGHIYCNGRWDVVKHPERCFIVFDERQHSDIVASETVAEARLEKLVSAPSIAGLAKLIGAKEESLVQTVDDFSKFASEGYDPAFQRPAETMRAFGEGPYYALELTPNILNTQGGPRRGAGAEVIGVSGEPVPHLYAAGECGGLTSNMYQGGGNMADNIIFGRIAGKNAAAVKE